MLARTIKPSWQCQKAMPVMLNKPATTIKKSRVSHCHADARYGANWAANITPAGAMRGLGEMVGLKGEINERGE
jgi:hypothetical protein